MKTTKNGESPWRKTKYANLLLYKPSGMYFARVRVGGKLFRESLKTDSVTTAKDRLDELVKRERRNVQKQEEIGKGRMTFGDALAMYQMRRQGDTSLKPRTRDYDEERFTALRKSWPELERLDVRKITKTECLNWAAKFAPTTSADAFNHTLAVLKHTLEIGVEVGARYDNPAKDVKRMATKPKQLKLPSSTEFAALVDCVRNAGGGFSRHCADLILFLAYGGFRKSEAANILWKNVRLNSDGTGSIEVHGDADTGTKNSEPRTIPTIPQMYELLERLRSEAGGKPDPNAPVMKVNECQKAIDRAAKELGIARFTHHDLRHLFATRCIESGVDIPTVAQWLGHKDKGALAMKVYGHLRQEHSQSMASKVRFDTARPTNSLVVKSFNVASGDADVSEVRATA